ncbi:MAG TPA: hypothetical protein VIS74_04830, partial [Chthoniobacterales bacterium]
MERIPRLNDEIQGQIELQPVETLRVKAGRDRVIEDILAILYICTFMRGKIRAADPYCHVAPRKNPRDVRRKTCRLGILENCLITYLDLHARSPIRFIVTFTRMFWAPDPLNV